MKQIWYWFVSNFYCFTILSNGHIRENFLTENKYYFNIAKCKRCKYVLGAPKWKITPHPPNSTQQKIESYNRYCEQYNQQLRESFSDKYEKINT